MTQEEESIVDIFVSEWHSLCSFLKRVGIKEINIAQVNNIPGAPSTKAKTLDSGVSDSPDLNETLCTLPDSDLATKMPSLGLSFASEDI